MVSFSSIAVEHQRYGTILENLNLQQYRTTRKKDSVPHPKPGSLANNSCCTTRLRRELLLQGVKLFPQLAQLTWNSARVRHRPIEASTALLPHCRHQASAIGKLGSVGIHFSTEDLQVASHASMIERG